MNNIDLNNIDLKKLPKHLQYSLVRLHKYFLITFAVVLVILYAFLILGIGEVAQNEPSDAEIFEQLEVVKRLEIDQDSIDKITQLQEQNVVVQSLFQEARDNPFKE